MRGSTSVVPDAVGVLFYAGIDEAGYGPMLGPLCVGVSAFLIHDHTPPAPPPNLWELLSDGVCTSPRDARRRVAVADSKRLKGARKAKAHPLRHLERGVLSFLGTLADHTPPHMLSDTDLFALLGAELPTTVSTPWYDSLTQLPVAHSHEMISIASARLRTTLANAGIETLDLGVISVDAGELNCRIAEGANKATVNQDTILQLVGRIRNVAANHDITAPRIVIDRQGGRTFYRSWLATCLPNASVKILGESPRVSRYEVADDHGTFVVSFETEAEDRHLPVALASMAAKYARELAMIRLNRYFNAFLPQLKPTAGYVQDGRRFMDDLKPVLGDLDLNRALLVRNA